MNPRFSLALLLIVACVDLLDASQFDFAKNLDQYLLARQDEQVDDLTKATNWLNSLGININGINDAFLNNYWKIIRFLGLYNKVAYCTPSTFEVVFRTVRLVAEKLDEQGAPSLKAILEPKLSSFADLCRDRIENELSSSANKVTEPVKTLVGQIFGAAETLLLEDSAYTTTSPIKAASLLSDQDMATIAHQVIVGQEDTEVHQIVQPGKESLPLSLISSVLSRFVKAPCRRYTDALSISPEESLAQDEIFYVLGRDNREQASGYNTAAISYSVCARFIEKSSNKKDEGLLERLLGQIVSEKYGKKVKSSGLLSCFGIGKGC